MHILEVNFIDYIPTCYVWPKRHDEKESKEIYESLGRYCFSQFRIIQIPNVIQHSGKKTVILNNGYLNCIILNYLDSLILNDVVKWCYH
jgi:hypothetical protein